MFCFNLNIEPQCDFASDTSLIPALGKANPGAKGSCFTGSPVTLTCVTWCVSRVVSDSPNHTMTQEASFALDYEAGYSGCTNTAVSSSFLHLTFSVQRQK